MRLNEASGNATKRDGKGMRRRAIIGDEERVENDEGEKRSQLRHFERGGREKGKSSTSTVRASIGGSGHQSGSRFDH